LFIWSYCPFGVQAQGPVAEVASLLKNSADFVSILYYDGHGDYETQQNKIQECIQKLDEDKYWAYASKFVSEIYPNCGASQDISCNEKQSSALMKSLGIDSTAVMDCVNSEGESLISKASSYAQQFGVTGSPTILINGVKVSVARNAESIKLRFVCIH
jgi:glutaredoxin